METVGNWRAHAKSRGPFQLVVARKKGRAGFGSLLICCREVINSPLQMKEEINETSHIWVTALGFRKRRAEEGGSQWSF